MKVLFLNPSRAGQGNIPLNIPLLISVLKQNNHQVCLFDITDYELFENNSYEDMFFKKASFNEQAIDDRRKFYKNEFCANISGYNLKKTDYKKDFDQLLNDFQSHIIAVSSLSIDFRFVCQFLLPFKKKYKIPVIFGGIHAILLPEETLHLPVCDFVCTGEGEKSFAELLDAIENSRPLDRVKGIWLKKNQSPVPYLCTY